jgi:glutamine phosphoribosylpyrophosphate amidotransferase
MCSIFGSFSKDKLVEFAKLTRYRGQHSFSYSMYYTDTDSIAVTKGLGEIPLEQIKIPPNAYCIAHMQAPTTNNKTIDYVHPAYTKGAWLWHNGIIKDHWVKSTMKKFNLDNSWDTFLILHKYLSTGNLNDIDGTFSCVYFGNGSLQLFRNEISPLFIDKDHNISSTKFEGSTSLEPNVIWELIPGKNIHKLGTFNTVENPYFFMDEAS